MNVKVSIYAGTNLRRVVEAESPAAWRSAVAEVRDLAGPGEVAVWEQPRGRFSYRVGDYRAVSQERR